MIIDAKTVAVTSVVIAVTFYWGLGIIRKFALQIAQENHSAMMKQDEAEEQQRLKKERNADAAAAAAFAKVEPMLKVSNVKTASKPENAETPIVTPAAVADV